MLRAGPRTAASRGRLCCMLGVSPWGHAMPERSGQQSTHLQDALRELLPQPRTDLALPVLPERSQRLLRVLEGMDAFVMEFDVDGQAAYVSPNVEAILGHTPEECLSDSALEIHPDDLHEVVAIGTKVRTTGKPAQNQTRCRHKDGHWVWIETTLHGWHAADTGEYHSITFNRDITQLKQAEAARRESEARYGVVSHMSRDLIIETDIEGTPTYISPGCEDIFGYTPEEMLAMDSWKLVHPDDAQQMRGQVMGAFRADPTRDESRPVLLEFRARTRDDRWIHLESLGRIYTRSSGEQRYLAVTRDVTERRQAEEARRRLEESLQRAQKLESLGILAGGIAHDFNNLLTPILGAAGLAIEELPEGSPVRDRLGTILRAGRRAAALTDQMLAYAGQRPLRVERVDLSRLVRDIRELAGASMSGKTTFELELAPHLPAVEGEAAQLSQVVLNLVTNASESLRDGKGHVTVRTGTVDLESPPAGALFADTMTAGAHVFFEVEDAGEGMDEETASRIFDPFFTTKFTGRGLGLAAVAGIVRAHRGAIQVDTKIGRGTRFRVLLPAAPRPEEPEQPAATREGDWRGHGTVLVIDDEEDVRELAATVLRRAGMKVLTAADGHEGLKLFGQHFDEIHLVLLDRTMPVLSGADTITAIRETKPDAKVILISGYSEEHATAEVAGRGVSFLQKPFDPESLLARVRESLSD